MIFNVIFFLEYRIKLFILNIFFHTIEQIKTDWIFIKLRIIVTKIAKYYINTNYVILFIKTIFNWHIFSIYISCSVFIVNH